MDSKGKKVKFSSSTKDNSGPSDKWIEELAAKKEKKREEQKEKKTQANTQVFIDHLTGGPKPELKNIDDKLRLWEQKTKERFGQK